MDSVITYISSHFLETLVLVLVCLLFIREAFIGWINTLLGRQTVPSRADATHALMEQLKAHYNDDTTRLLAELEVGQREIKNSFQSFRETQLTQCNKLDEMRDILRDMQRDGIRIRK
jgi:hypothetical protein